MYPRSLLATAAAIAGTLACAGPASAAPLKLSETVSGLAGALLPKQDPACANPATTKPFAAWGDHADYVPVPNGSFEAGLDGWTSRGRVDLVDDNEPWKVGGDDHTTAAAITDGASITSGSFCGGLEYPTVRLFAKSTAPVGVFHVNVLYTGRDSLLHALPLGVMTAGDTWRPTTIALTASGLPLLTGVKLAVSVTSIVGDVTVDDLYVDPYRRS